mmetsp:Transcript_6/g.37  ORF Transcript_6/g.37 Transcript_6/m.37 type:complete len:235 (-) Transcript_6:2680-3384(-)
MYFLLVNAQCPSVLTASASVRERPFFLRRRTTLDVGEPGETDNGASERLEPRARAGDWASDGALSDSTDRRRVRRRLVRGVGEEGGEGSVDHALSSTDSEGVGIEGVAARAVRLGRTKLLRWTTTTEMLSDEPSAYATSRTCTAARCGTASARTISATCSFDITSKTPSHARTSATGSPLVSYRTTSGLHVMLGCWAQSPMARATPSVPFTRPVSETYPPDATMRSFSSGDSGL